MDGHYNTAFILNQNDCEFSRKIKNSVTQLENVPKYFSTMARSLFLGLKKPFRAEFRIIQGQFHTDIHIAGHPASRFFYLQGCFESICLQGRIWPILHTNVSFLSKTY